MRPLGHMMLFGKWYHTVAAPNLAAQNRHRGCPRFYRFTDREALIRQMYSNNWQDIETEDS